MGQYKANRLVALTPYPNALILLFLLLEFDVGTFNVQFTFFI
jgi:hypothetical protein